MRSITSQNLHQYFIFKEIPYTSCHKNHVIEFCKHFTLWLNKNNEDGFF